MDDLQELLNAVKDVRNKQRQYFAMRRSGNVNAPSALEASKAAERYLDQLVKEIEINQQKKNDTQINLL